MLCVLALTIGGMIFTLWYAKDNAKTNSNGQITNTQMNGTPPTMPDGNNNSNDNSYLPDNHHPHSLRLHGQSKPDH